MNTVWFHSYVESKHLESVEMEDRIMVFGCWVIGGRDLDDISQKSYSFS